MVYKSWNVSFNVQYNNPSVIIPEVIANIFQVISQGEDKFNAIIQMTEGAALGPLPPLFLRQFLFYCSSNKKSSLSIQDNFIAINIQADKTRGPRTLALCLTAAVGMTLAIFCRLTAAD